MHAMTPAYVMRRALDDVFEAFKRMDLALFMAWEDVRQRYVRTTLGPFWIVLNTAVWFGVMGFVMANLFGQPLASYMPFLATGLIVWMLISNTLGESPQLLIQATPIITTFNIPIFLHFLRFSMRNYIIFLHNALILVLTLIVFPPAGGVLVGQALLALLLLTPILLSMAIILALVNLRFRDTQLAVSSALQILPLVTPVFWDRPMLKEHPWIADLNPFYHLIEIVRAPILGQAPTPENWLAVGLIAVFLSCAALLLFLRYRHRIIFWA